MTMARFEYKTVNIDTLDGLEQGVRLLATGWKIIRAGLCLVQFARPAATKRSPMVPRLGCDDE